MANGSDQVRETIVKRNQVAIDSSVQESGVFLFTRNESGALVRVHVRVRACVHRGINSLKRILKGALYLLARLIILAIDHARAQSKLSFKIKPLDFLAVQ